MNLYPDAMFDSVLEIDTIFLNKNNIKALILDVDNTLIDYYKNLSDEVVQWANILKHSGIKLYILSNTNKKKKVETVASRLGIKYEYFARKPSKRGFKKIQKILNLKPEEIGVVGDQIFTDVKGGKRCNMFTILVEPVTPKDFWYTAWKRPFEAKIKKKAKEYLESTKEK